MPSFEQDHFFLLELANILEPKEQYSLDYTFSSIDSEIAEKDNWEETIDGSRPVELDDITPWFWYTQYWVDCNLLRQYANLDGYEFREICDYTFEDDEATIPDTL